MPAPKGQQHDEYGTPLCGLCGVPILAGQTYMVAHERDLVDADPSVMVHLDHFAAIAPQSTPVNLRPPPDNSGIEFGLTDAHGGKR